MVQIMNDHQAESLSRISHLAYSFMGTCTLIYILLELITFFFVFSSRGVACIYSAFRLPVPRKEDQIYEKTGL